MGVMMAEKHKILGGKVTVYKRERSGVWQCSTYLNGKNHRVSTKEDGLSRAKEFAEDWYLELRGKKARGELITERTFAQAAEKFEREYVAMTEGERNEVYVNGHKGRLRNHLIPYFGKMALSKITPGVVQEYRIFRKEGEGDFKPPSKSTMHHEIVTLRQVLKLSIRYGWLGHLPDLSDPYRGSSKVTHRAWFSPEEYKQLYTATRENMKKAAGSRHAASAEQLHDFILFMANTGLRPDEANRLEFRDVEVAHDDDTRETILEIKVRGKRGTGYCKSMPGAVLPFERMKARKRPAPEDLLFPSYQVKQFNRILTETDLKYDREGNRRSLYSLRHSYISFRLLEGADIYQIAKNCRTSVEMIEKHYAVHLKNVIDASAINVRRSKR